MSRALVAVVVAPSLITTESSVLVSITGGSNAEANSDVGCVVFSNVWPTVSTCSVLWSREF